MANAEQAQPRQRLVPIETYRTYQNGQDFVSDWVLVDQTMIDRFALATHDHQFIHVDPERARSEGPYGGTVAHGFLTLSLLSVLAYDAMPGVEGMKVGVNYGFDKVRFVAPVKSGAKVRGRFRLVGITERAVTIQSAWEAAIEIEGGQKPALTAEWITVAIIDPPA
ncbi:MaoC family dehydratase [Aureimonas fodinaquatilis]|uniref:MaoC family dehydratase n=1 Tax=Aureimonas fodinaquatilis TaxID=2565783 RepID=A0A5B0E245_9HYPH|nr:MaoC family dehydratase [Aureimonas fodinaquatilis]KAA0972738.1 MaoC family dehydratase [Aureimonas fodinaquatilis]